MFGLFQLPWWGYLVVLLSLTQITILAVTLYLHRCQAHRALVIHPIVSHFFRFWLWLTTGMVTKEWAAIHRKHHAKVERVGDPHSPVVMGLKKVFFEGAELYRKESKNQETLERYGEGTPDDWIERNLYTRWSMAGIYLMLSIDLVLFGTMGLTIWALQMAWIPLFAAGVINGIGHFWGYRNFEVQDNSRNILPIGFFLGGEELHNNHHAFATSAKFSAKWWEVDMGWYVIRLLQLFGLAKPKRIVPQPKMLPTKTCIDTDTLKAIIMYRFQVMSRYSREVVMPVLQEEKKRASKASKMLLCRAKTILVCDSSIMKASQRLRLAAVLENFQSLRVIYQFRIKLQDIWNRSTASQKELLDALQEWCQQAEATGIETLHKFSCRLKTYVPQTGGAKC
ncbi:MAG: fatty acid desaturase [Gammaproteobacteria bacterium]|nr:fatty acid desaturase [Gammaproteobacteria bacterium]MCW5582348.1 fatty acid desaturase [Gammaproteobacteria bacterium]